MASYVFIFRERIIDKRTFDFQKGLKRMKRTEIGLIELK